MGKPWALRTPLKDSFLIPIYLSHLAILEIKCVSIGISL